MMTTTAAATENDEGRPNGTALDQQHHDPATTSGDHDQDTSTGDDRPEPARFRDWLVQQQDHADDYVRTVAGDAADDDTWPEDAATLDDLRGYIAKVSGYDGRADVGIRHAWSLWSGQPLDDDEDQDQVERVPCPRCDGPTLYDPTVSNRRICVSGTRVKGHPCQWSRKEPTAKPTDDQDQMTGAGLFTLAPKVDEDGEPFDNPAEVEDQDEKPASESSNDDEDQDDAGPSIKIDERGRLVIKDDDKASRIVLPHHRAELHALGLTDDDIARMGIFSNPVGAPGWCLPWTDGVDEVRPVIIDRDKRQPDGPKIDWPKGQTLILGRVREVEGSTRDIIVEGPRQALMVATYAPPDRSVFVMNGADGIHKGIAGRLRIFEGCQITLMVDGDWRRNEHVGKAATERAPAILDRAGVAEVLVADVGGKGTDGIDDILLRTPVEERAEVLAKILDGARPAPERRFEVEVEVQLLRMKARQEAQRRLDAEEAEDRPPPEVTDLAALLAEPEDEVEDRVAGLWPKDGNVVLAAQRKAGKTTLVGNLVRSLVDGDGFLEPPGPFSNPDRRGFDVVQLADDERVLVADLELSRRTLRKWLRDQKVGNVDRVLAESFRGRLDLFDVLDEARRQMWADYLAENRVRVLVVDPLAPLLAFYGHEENDNTGVARVLAGLDQLKAAAGVEELLVVHHMGHGPERSRGASRLRDWPDAEWRLVRESAGQGEEPPPDAARFLVAEGRDVMVPETRLDYDRDTRRLWVAGGNRVAHQATKHGPAILEIVKRDPGSTQTDIVEMAQILGVAKRDKARDAIRKLVADGKVHTAKGQKRALLHFPDDGCATPDDCQSAEKYAAKDQGKNQGKNQGKDKDKDKGR
jgi:AAA domain